MNTFLRPITGGGERFPAVAVAVMAASLIVLAAAAALGGRASVAVGGGFALVVGAVASRRVLRWQNLLATLVVVIVFIPIRRYTLPGSLPFDLEPYRLLIAFIALGWLTSLLIDPRVRARRTAFDAPLALFAIGALASVASNTGRAEALGVTADVAKKLSFFASFLLVVYLISSLVRTRAHLDFLVKVMVTSGGILAIFAIIEGETHYNVFNHLDRVAPFLKRQPLAWSLISLANARGARLRVYASAEHPIALGAFLVMLVPLAIYLIIATRKRRWALAGVLITMAALATVSRTAITMLLTVILVYLFLRGRQVRRFWPLIVPLLLAVHIALPGTLGGFKDAFFPKGGIIAEQKKGEGSRGSGRVNQLGPSIKEWKQHALFGEGLGTRITDKGRQNAPILDNQWLGTLLETGFIGIVSFVWLFTRFVRRLGRAAKEDDSPLGWLAAGLAGSVAAFAVGMFTYDAFSFIQVTFGLFIQIGLGASLLGLRARTAPAR